MRRVRVMVPSGEAGDVFERLADLPTINSVATRGFDPDDEWDIVTMQIPNEAVDDVIAAVGGIEGVRITLDTSGVLALASDSYERPRPAIDVTPRSAVEIFLNRTLGESTDVSLLGYSAVAGAVVWIGLFEEVGYLLVAAMLVAPFAVPALTTAVASASGDVPMLRRGLTQYVWTVLVTIAVATGISLAAQLRLPTTLMVDVVSLSPYSVLLPIAAGVAGGLFVVHSDEANTVSGAAVGMLVAAALAPPAGVAGMALAIVRWDLLAAAVFVITAQLVGINLVAGIVFRLYGMSPTQPRFSVGRRGVFPATVAVGVAAFAVLAVIAVMTPITQRDRIAHLATVEIEEALETGGMARLVEADVRFSPYRVSPDRLVATVHVEPREGVDPTVVGEHVETVTAGALRAVDPRARPLVDVVVLPEP